MRQYLVLDLGGTFTKYALMDGTGAFLEKGQTPSALDSLESLLSSLSAIGEDYRGKYEGIAVSMPGRIDTRLGIAHTGGAFTFLRDTPFAQMLEERLSVPVTLGNDAKCAASAEAWKGVLSGGRDGVVIVLGTGTGGGLVLNGRVWMGHTFGAGELSWLVSNLAALPYDTQNDTQAQSSPMGALWARYMSATGLLSLYRARKGLGPNDPPVDGFRFFAAYDAGEPEARAALEEFGRFAAGGIFSLQSVLDVPCYAIGGGISARAEVTEEIRRALDHLFQIIPTMPPFIQPPFGKPEVVTCQFGNDANLIGALSFHLQRVNDPRPRFA